MSQKLKSRTKFRLFSFQDSPRFLGYAFILLSGLVVVIGSGISSGAFRRANLVDLAWWLAFCAVANLLPIPTSRNISLSMSSPINIAIAFLFSPPVAAALTVIGSVSEWELKRQTTPMHALFNRGQIALATAASSAVFAAVGAIAPLIVAIVAGTITYEIHVLFVAIAERTSRDTPWKSIAKTLLPPGLAGTAVYLALGFLGIVFALAFERIGAWAVVTLLIPLLITRHALRVSRQLEQAEHDRRALADRLIDERERERTRIASQIHDGVLQQLAALQLQADNMRSAVQVNDLIAVEHIAAQTTAGLRQSIDDLRSSIRNLRRVSLDDGGLVPTLKKFARSFHAETGIPVEVHTSAAELDIPLPVGLLLYECCQEALTNVARHARASKVRVNLGRVGESVLLHVIDDGVGGVEAISTNGLGLSLMKDKVALAGGGMWVDSNNERGTEVTISVPVGSS